MSRGLGDVYKRQSVHCLPLTLPDFAFLYVVLVKAIGSVSIQSSVPSE
nr:hypothetical protein [Elizabethkingia sp. ASV34]